MTDKGIYLIDFDAAPPGAAKLLKCFDFVTRKVTQVGSTARIHLTGEASFSSSRDGRWVIGRQGNRSESNIMLIDNCR